MVDNRLPTPKIEATKSKLRIPTRPQLSPPMITKIKAIQSNMLSFIYTLMHYGTRPFVKMLPIYFIS